MGKSTIGEGFRKKALAVLSVLICLLVLCSGFTAEAEAEPQREAAFNPIAKQLVLNTHVDNGMSVTNTPVNGWPAVVSQAAVVMDADTGAVVYQKNGQAEHYPASITKILTAMLALKYGHLDDTLVATKESVAQPPDQLYMRVGETAQLGPLLYGLLLNSANDAAVMIADKYSGSVSNFANLMNQEVANLGLHHTHFVNPNGLPNENHVTSAYDMAVITRAAMENAEFRKIVDTKAFDWHGEAWSQHFVNLNHMLFQYPGCIGVKTGFTSLAHQTLVVAAKHNGTTFIAVLMDAPTDFAIRHDATGLLNFAFSHYRTDTLASTEQSLTTFQLAGNQSYEVMPSEDVVATVPLRSAPAWQYSLNLHYDDQNVPAHAFDGALSWTIGGKSVGESPVFVDDPQSNVSDNTAVRSINSGILGCVALVVFSIGAVRRMLRRPGY